MTEICGFHLCVTKMWAKYCVISVRATLSRDYAKVWHKKRTILLNQYLSMNTREDERFQNCLAVGCDPTASRLCASGFFFAFLSVITEKTYKRKQISYTITTVLVEMSHVYPRL